MGIPSASYGLSLPTHGHPTDISRAITTNPWASHGLSTPNHKHRMDYQLQLMGIRWASHPMGYHHQPMDIPQASHGPSPLIHGHSMDNLRAITTMSNPWAAHGQPVGIPGDPSKVNGSPHGMLWSTVARHGVPRHRLSWHRHGIS